MVDDEDFEYLSKYKWTYHHKNYAIRYDYSNSQKKFLLMHRVIMKAKKGQIVDHKDGNGLNNSKDNLRFCTSSGNMQNSKLAVNNTSGYKGVFGKENSWRASVGKNGKRYWLGTFKNKIDAVKAYNLKAKELHGEFARLNDI